MARIPADQDWSKESAATAQGVRRLVERAARESGGEEAQSHLHAEVFRPTTSLLAGLAFFPDGEFADPASSPSCVARASGASERLARVQALAHLRQLVQTPGTLERQLHRVLSESTLLRYGCLVSSEVTIVPSPRRPGALRMDLLVGPCGRGADCILELKRTGVHLLVRRGRDAVEISAALARAIHQVRGYRDGLVASEAARSRIESKTGLDVSAALDGVSMELRLVAGRRASGPGRYSVLQRCERKQGVSISTWDAFLEELERSLS